MSIKNETIEITSGKKMRGQFFTTDMHPDLTGSSEKYAGPWLYAGEIREYAAAGAQCFEGQRKSDGTYVAAGDLTPEERAFEQRFKYASTGEEVVFVATQARAQKIAKTGGNAVIKRAGSLSKFNGRVEAPTMWLDIDDAEDLARARLKALAAVDILRRHGVPDASITILFSGSKGFHVKFDAACIGKDLVSGMPVQALSKRLSALMPALFPDTDPKAYLATQLLRVPNTRNDKSGLFCIPLSVRELTDLGIDEIRALAASPRMDAAFAPPSAASVSASLRAAALTILERVEAQAAEYGRQQVAAAVGGTVTEEQLLAWLDANEWPHSPPQPLDAGRKIIRLGRCPLEDSHGSPGGDQGSFIRYSDGTIVFKCFHSGCTPPTDPKTGRAAHSALTRRAIDAITAAKGATLALQANIPAGGTDLTALTDALVGALFRNPAGQLTLRSHRGVFYLYKTNGYLEIPDGDVENIVMDWLRQNAPRDATVNKLKTVMAQLSAVGAIPFDQVFGSWIANSGPVGDQLAVNNGILDIDGYLRGEPLDICLRPHSPEYFDAPARPFDFNPAAECPVFQTFLTQALPEPELRDTVQDYAGYALTTSCKFQRFMIFTGIGANGKTTAGDIVAGIVGDAHMSSVPVSSFGGRFQLWPLASARLNYVSELPVSDGALSIRLAEEKLKAVVSGDPIEVERKHRDSYSVRPTAKLLFLGNELPPFFDRSNGIWRRLLIVPFRNVVPESEQVADLAKLILREEGSGVLNWALAGLKRLAERGGFKEPPGMLEVKNEHRMACDHESEYLVEHYRFNSALDESSMANADFATIMRKYREWCTANGYYPVGKNKLGEAIKRCFPDSKPERRTVQANPYGPVKKITAYIGLVEDI